ncbi:MAG: hypothetical protein CMI15_00715 [Opitutaceae bacterium]|nr:hypothetical protein [Opitutaceae bacterium]
MSNGELIAYYGTSGQGMEDGIYRQRIGRSPFSLGESDLLTVEAKAGFFRFNKDRSILYSIATGENDRGLAKAFARAESSGDLEPINSQEAAGQGMCHINLDRTERWLLGASYGDAMLSVFPLNDAGEIQPLVQSLRLEGEGSQVLPDRQEAPHAHSIYTDPSNRYAFACDLGMDRIWLYRVDEETGQLEAAEKPYVETVAGAGPRHLAFHGNGRWIYALNELNGTVGHYVWHADKGVLEPMEIVSTLPEDVKELNISAEILVHPSNRSLYASNRGHDSLAVFSISDSDGSLEPIQRISSGGGHPRNFVISPEGDLLAVANRDSNNIVYFAVDSESGELTHLETVDGIPACTCVRIVPA